MKAALGLLMLSLSAAAQTAPARVESALQISGTVVDARTGQPVNRAEVTIAPVTNRGATRQVVTRPDGAFSFPNVAPGKYSLGGAAKGYRVQGFRQHENYSTAIAVGNGLESTGLLFRLQPDASISGRITDEYNEAVRNAELTLFHSTLENGQRITQPVSQAQTDDLGIYHFPHLPPGKYFVAVRARPWFAEGPRRHVVVFDAGRRSITPTEGSNSLLNVSYPVTYYPGVTESAAAGAITAVPGEKFTADIPLRAVPAVRLRIHGAGAERGAFPRLAQYGIDGNELPVQGTYSDSEGTMVMDGVAPGHYVLILQSAYANQGGGVVRATERRRELDVFGDTEVELDEITPGVSVSGEVTFDGPAPRGMFPVVFRSRTSRRAFGAVISPNGEFEITEGLPAGTYDVALGSAQYLVQSLSATGAKTAGQSFEVRGEGAIRLKIVASKASGRVDGTVLRESKPVAGAMVVLVPEDMHSETLFRRDQSDSDGTFTLPMILPGKYTVIAIENGWDLEWGDPAVLLRFLSGGTRVQVEANGKQKIEVTVQ